MLSNRQLIQENFAAELREKLRRHYRGRVPSAAAFATHFNQRISKSETGISQETARRWLRGKSLPDQVRLSVLVNWLDLEVHGTLYAPKPLSLVMPLDDYSREVLKLLSKIENSKKSDLLNLLRLSVAA